SERPALRCGESRCCRAARHHMLKATRAIFLQCWIKKREQVTIKVDAVGSAQHPAMRGVWAVGDAEARADVVRVTMKDRRQRFVIVAHAEIERQPLLYLPVILRKRAKTRHRHLRARIAERLRE